ncbi:MAG: DHH family phosphoesterase [Candidatus Sericytochromatia bacterium]|nr:DHH family phosphoesterase [Candidatus Sericytochromatia bacterium]
MDAVSNVSGLPQVAGLLLAEDRFLITPHTSPDPDAFGSCCGLALLLQQLGKQVVVYCDETVPQNCHFLTEGFPVSTELPADIDRWKVLFLDGGEQHRQLKPVRALSIWMNLDHHLDNGRFAEWIYVDTNAAATSLIVAQLAEYLPVQMCAKTAECLFTGILFDTRGGFVTDRCTGDLYRTVGKLVDAGARPDDVNRQLHEQISQADLQVYGHALSAVKTRVNGQVVYTCLTREMQTLAGQSDQAMEMITQHLPKIQGGEVYVLFKEVAPELVKVSLRSKGRIAVNEIAKQFGGGGHKFASGLRIDASLEEAIASVVPACERAVQVDWARTS